MALVVKNPLAYAGDSRDVISIPGLGRFCGEGNGNPLQYSCLEYPMDREAWQAYNPLGSKSQTQLNWLSMHTCVKIMYYQVSFRYPSHMYIAHKSCIYITVNCGKFFKRLEYQTTFLPPEKRVCRSRSNSYNQTWNMYIKEIGKRVHQGCILSPCLFNLYTKYILWNAGLDES